MVERSNGVFTPVLGKGNYMKYIKVYTKQAAGAEYPNSFANSVHFALCDEDGKAEELNQGCGILYACAKIREDDTLLERGVKNPVLFEKDGQYGILAEYVDAQGNPQKPDTLLLWNTEDFVDFSEQREVSRAEYSAYFESGNRMLPVTDEQSKKIRVRFIPLCSVSAEYPKKISVSNVEELSAVSARVTYSDGSMDEKRIYWDEQEIHALNSGSTGILHGEIRAVSPKFPQAVGYADPVIFHWEGAWYFLATNDNVNDIGIFVRRRVPWQDVFRRVWKHTGF